MTEYKVIRVDKFDKFEKEVQELIKEGYYPDTNSFRVTEYNSSIIYHLFLFREPITKP